MANHESYILPVEQIVTGSGFEDPRLAPDQAIDLMRSKWVTERAAICAMDNETDGLDIDRLQDFASEHGAPNLPIIALSPKDYGKATMLAYNEKKYAATDGKLAIEHGLILAKRDPVLERVYGPRVTEAVIAHEIGHATAMPTARAQVDVEYKKQLFGGTNGRVSGKVAHFGFHEFPSAGEAEGHVFEEGYAEHLRGAYVRDKLGMARGFNDLSVESTPLDVHAYGREGSQNFLNGAYGAYLLGQMCEMNADLSNALRSARADISAKNEVIDIVNSFESGMYDKLNKLHYYDDRDTYIRTVAQAVSTVANFKKET
jgi:hypothetical protein